MKSMHITLIALLLGLSIQGSGPYVPMPIRPTNQPTITWTDMFNTLTATRTRKVICCLAAALLAHKVYKVWCHKTIREQAQTIKDQPILNSDRPVRWVFVHGVGDRCREQGQKYTALPENPLGFMPADYFPVDFDDAVKNLRASYYESGIPWKDLANIRNNCSLAQEAEIARIKELFDQYPNDNFILFGVSRGAAAIINYVAQYKPGNVKAIILESPFDDMQSVISGLLSKCYLNYVPGLADVGNLICAGLFRNYSTCHVAPIDVVAQIPKHIPVLFVCSEKDPLIPYASTNKLHEALLLAGHKKSKLLRTSQGGHAEIITGPDAYIYKGFVDVFLRNFNLAAQQ